MLTTLKSLSIPPEFLPSHSFNPSFLSFPQHLPSTFSLSALHSWYLHSNPLHPALLFASFYTVLVWILGEITGNVSHVDRSWTMLPIVYSAHFTFFPLIAGTKTFEELDQRQLLVFGLQLLWSARLTTNTYRRGFFNPKEEDYRWDYVRQRIPTWQFKLLNLFFIAIIQNALLLAAELPVYLLSTLPSSPSIGYVDYGLSALFVGILVVEMIADNQQQKYQNWKHSKNGGGDGRGFITNGLWSWSRHPNFACEQSTWWVLYLFTVLPFLPLSTFTTLGDTLQNFVQNFSLSQLIDDVQSFSFASQMDNVKSVSAADLKVLVQSALHSLKSHEGLFWNYSIWSPITMSLLFYASTDLTEKISSGKYPAYKNYQKRVGMFWPPITILKSVWVFITGQKGRSDRDVFGNAGKVKKL